MCLIESVRGNICNTLITFLKWTDHIISALNSGNTEKFSSKYASGEEPPEFPALSANGYSANELSIPYHEIYISH